MSLGHTISSFYVCYRMMPWAHSHQLKAITRFVLAIIDKQTGCQAELARAGGPSSGRGQMMIREEALGQVISS